MAFYVICEHCGQLMLEEFRRCPNCGSRVEGLSFGERSRRGYYYVRATAFVGLLLVVVVVIFLLATAANVFI